MLRSRRFLTFCVAPTFATPLLGQDPTALDAVLDREQRRIEASCDLFEDHSSWENAWECRSEHYLVRTTHSYGLAKAVADGQEVMLGHFRRLFGNGVERESPFVIHVREDVAAYNEAGEEFGAEHSSFYGSFHAATAPGSPVEVVHHPNRTWLQMQITHSTLHQWLHGAHPGVTLPAWLEEGLAAYFSLYWDPAWGASELARIRDAGRALDLRLLGMTSMPSDPSAAQEFLIQIGMLFTWLMDHREDTRVTREPDGSVTGGTFRQAIVDLLAGESANEVLRTITALGPIEDVLAEFRAYDFGR